MVSASVGPNGGLVGPNGASVGPNSGDAIYTETGIAQSIAAGMSVTLWSMIDAGKSITSLQASGAALIPSGLPLLTMPTKLIIVNSGETQVTINDS